MVEKISKRRITFCTVLFLMMSAFSSTLYAEPNEAFEYQKAVIQSLSWSKEAQDLIKINYAETSDWEAGIENNSFARAKIRNAIRDIEDFTKSKNEFISKSGYMLMNTYQRIDKVLEKWNIFVQKLLDGEKLKRGSNAIELANLSVEADEAWKSLVNSAIMTTYCLRNFNNDGDVSTHLVITKLQRDELSNSLVRIYGENVKVGIKSGQLSHEAAAAAIYYVLNDQGYKMADE